MNIEEIKKYLSLGNTKSVCVNRQLSLYYEGFVIDITIQKDNVLKQEFNTHGFDEGGLVIFFKYENLDNMITSVESYLGKKLADWENISKTGYYPELDRDVDFTNSGIKIKSDLVEGKIRTPKGWNESYMPVGYWKNLVDGKL